MVELISFPASGLLVRTHVQGLEATKKRFWVGLAPNECLEAIRSSSETPKLMFLDFGIADNMGEMIWKKPVYGILAEIPAIIITDIRNFDITGLRVIGRMGVEEQFEPDGFIKVVGAYEAACAASPGQPINEKAYASALRTVVGAKIA